MAVVFSYKSVSPSTSGAKVSVPGTAVGLEIRLFGSMEVRVGGHPMPRLRSRKGLWLLALLALRAGRDVDREWLAGTLWSDCRDDAARRSLRQSLHDLRCALGPEAGRLSCDSPRTLRLDLSSDARVDVLEFDASTIVPNLARSPDMLESAVRLYRGPLLEDCAEDWVIEERRQREQQYISALELLASTAAAYSGHIVAAGYLRLAVGVDPLREDLQRALMESLAAEGSVSAALLVFRQFRTRLWQEMATEPDAETTAVYRRLRDEARKVARVDAAVAPTTPEPSVSERTLSSLPQPRTALIGREKDEEEVVACLTHARLVTLTGTGGVGKTRLSLRVAEKMADEFEGGTRFVNLAPLTDPAGVPEAVRKALDVPLQGESARQPLVEVLCRSLSCRRLLLVLDNCEQVLDACAVLTDALLAACPGLRVLATSRQALGLRGEVVWRVPSLAVPPSSVTEADYTDYSAVRLFLARAHDHDSTFQVNPHSVPALVHVCRRLDGIPLAIELAAARVRALTVEEINARLGDQFRLLTGGDRAALPRQKTLRGALDWSWDLLTEPEKVLLSRLSVFAGGWTLEAVESICAGGGVEEAEILDLITTLVDKSLVIAEKREGGTTRYRSLETVRQYGRDRLAECGEPEVAAVCTRHQKYFSELASKRIPDYMPEWGAGFDWVETEQDNLRTALEWRGLSGEAKQAVAQRVLDLAGTLGVFWVEKVHLQEGQERLQNALSFADEFCADKDKEAYRSARAKAMRYLAALIRDRGNYTEAQILYGETLAEYRQLGYCRNIASVLSQMGVLSIFQSNFERAQLLLQESLALHRKSEDRRSIAFTLTALGVIVGDQGDLAQARSFMEEALTIHQEMGNKNGIAKTLTNLGNTVRSMGEYDQSRVLLEKALAIHREMGNQRSVALALLNLGGCIGDLGDYPTARHQIEEALALFREAGNKDFTGNALTALGIVVGKQNDPARARTLLNEALRLHRELGSPHMIATTLKCIGCVDAAQGQLVQAMRLWGASEKQREVMGAPLKFAERLEHEQEVAQVRAALGEDDSNAAWTEGRTTSIEDICARVLG